MLNKSKRTLTLAAACLFVGAGALSYSARAQDKMGDDKMMADKAMTDKAVTDQMTKMKEAAKDPARMTAMRDEMARMMVEHHMAMKMAMDPDMKKMTADAMADPDMKKMMDSAAETAADPAKTADMKQQIMNDPAEMKKVMEASMSMAMMHDKMMSDGKMGDMKMGDMKDKMEPMKDKMEDMKDKMDKK